LKALEPFCEEIHLLSVPVWRRLLHLSKVPFTSIPLQTLYLYDDCFRAKARELLCSQSFDLIHVQTVRMAPIINELSPRVPAVLDLIDALSVNMAQRARRRLSPQTLVAGWESCRLQYYERELVKRYSQLAISSQKDLMAIGNFPNIHVVPNGVDLEAFPLFTGKRDPATIVFTGSMWYFPNVDAVAWFVGNVFPLVRQQIPDAQVFIVGGKPARAVQRLAQGPGVIVTGYVPRVQDYLSKATIAIAPMQGGSGMQFKVIEAMANGAPVVATPYALGGLEAIDGEHLLIAQNAATFAEQVVYLLSDPELRLQLSRNARKLVEEKYSWERTVAMLESVYRLTIER
jgi:sugar transferase (PEP-CTERM/EpsH1 system associated)